MYRVVFDPGVLVAALISPRGLPARVLREWLDGSFELVVSPGLLGELRKVLGRAKFTAYVSADEVADFVALIGRFAIVQRDPRDAPRTTPDPGDDYLVALATVSGADFLVSGDSHLTELSDVDPPVLTPRRFAELLPRLSP